VGNLLKVTARNVGGHHASKFSVGLYISKDPKITTSDKLLLGGREFVNGLPAGHSVNVHLAPSMRIPTAMLPGNYHIGVLLDESNKVPESHEGNNWRSKPIKIFP